MLNCQLVQHYHAVLTHNVKNHEPTYEIAKAHKEILLDFDDAEANAFHESFGNSVMSLIRGCSVHFMRSAMRVAKVVNSSSVSTGYLIFMAITKRIPDEPSQSVVLDAFDVLSSQKPFTSFSYQLSATRFEKNNGIRS